MAHTLWTLADGAAGSPISALAQVNKTANSANRTALFNNTTADAYVTGATIGVFGVSAAEMSDAGIGQVASVTVSTAGTGYTVRPTATFSGGGQAASGATAQVTAKVVTSLIHAAGTGFAPGDVVTINTTGSAGATTSARFNVATVTANAVTSLTINTAGAFTTLPTNIANNATTNTTGAGTGLRINLAFGVLAVTMTANGVDFTTEPTVTFGGAGGTGSVATAALRSEQAKVTSAGWVLRKAFGSRVQYETLVATKNLTGDANADDTQLPE